jgi:hypothetical protein
MFPDHHFKGNFSDFAKLYLKGILEYGDYWTMLKVKKYIVDYCQLGYGVSNSGKKLAGFYCQNQYPYLKEKAMYFVN